MARENLTDRRVKSLKAATEGTRYELFDAQVPQMGVRVTDKGAVTFFLLARFNRKNPTRRALGRYPTLPLHEAREKSREWLRLLDKGEDPKEVQKREAENRARANALASERSFASVLDRYLEARQRDGLRKADIDDRDFKRVFLPAWKGRSVDSLSMADIMAVLGEIQSRGHTRQALNMAQKIGTFFNWCCDAEIIEASPYRPKRIRAEIGEKRARDRVLSNAEIQAMWHATDKLPIVFQSVYRLLLLTGQRLNDVAQASWPEIDLEARTFTVPAARFKSDRDHVLPLTDDALEIITGVPRWRECDWIFSNDGKVPVSMGSKIKAKLDEEMLKFLRQEDPNASLQPWVNHDLRRTVRTRLSDLDVYDEVAEQIIGHAPTAINRTYNKSDRLRVKLEALRRWETALRNVLKADDDASNVIDFELRHS